MAREVKNTRTGWVCAAVVMALFGLQQILPLQQLALRGPDGLAATLLHSFSCMFLHGHLLHASVNALTFICLFSWVKRGAATRAALTGLISGWLATFLFAVFLMPHNAWMVGSSGILFGTLGWFTATEPFSRWSFCFVGSAPLIVLAPAFVFLDGMTAIFFFKANAWQVHSTAFAAGAAMAVIANLKFQIPKD